VPCTHMVVHHVQANDRSTMLVANFIAPTCTSFVRLV
jgi:hypothetical protein